MEAVLTFCLAFAFSFIGTLPPGTINLSIIQLGLDHKLDAAWRFAAAAAIVEYFYGWLAIEFEQLITSSPAVTENFQLITAIVMTTLGVITLRASRKQSDFSKRFSESGFRRGIVLGILNPLALPFWVAMTAYIKSLGWVDLSTTTEKHLYLLGVSAGGFSLLMLFAVLARQVVKYFQGNTWLKKVPGATLLVLGGYAFIQYFF